LRSALLNGRADRLIAAGLHCDVLVHEATFDDSLQADAIAKRHCTVAEAVQVSRDMHAKVSLVCFCEETSP
jgi:ribonuclease Z